MRKTIFVLLVITLVIAMGACALIGAVSKTKEVQEIEVVIITPSPEPTPEPSPTPSPTPVPTPIQTTEPEPTPTPTPFSYYAPTTTMTFEELVGDNGIRDPYPKPPPPGTYYVVINVKYQLVLVYEKDEDGEYTKPVRYMSCSSGAVNTPTRLGSYELEGRHVRFGHFVNFNQYGQYWTRIFGRTYFHSLLYTKRHAQYYIEETYEDLGTQASHACIRLYVPDAMWITYYIAPGTKVDVIAGEEDEALQAIKDQMIFPPLPEERPVLNPGEVPISEPVYTPAPKEEE